MNWSPSYRDLLERAGALGRADALLAVGLEPGDGPDPSSRCCRGRDPAGFARLLWGAAGGRPPAGLEVNAPLWYVQGFRDQLAELRSDRAARESALFFAGLS